MINPKKYEIIDPLALIFPPSLYAKIVEGKFPHVPKIEVVRKAIRGMTKLEKEAIQARTRAMLAAAKVIEEAMG